MFELSNLAASDLIEVRSLRVKTPYQPVSMLIQAPLPGVIRVGKIDRRSRYFRNFFVLCEFRVVVSGQGFKLAEGIRHDVSERGHHCLGPLIGQLANNDRFQHLIYDSQQE